MILIDIIFLISYINNIKKYTIKKKLKYFILKLAHSSSEIKINSF
jgi:hypothetical protein